MSSLQRQQEELSALASIFRADELSVTGADGGVFRAHVRAPAGLVVHSVGGHRDPLPHLPPLALHFTLPPDYPDNAPPTFMLAGHWLSRGRLSRLCRRLDELYEPGQEALFTWFSFLQDDAWAFLGLSDALSVAPLQRRRAQRPCPPTKPSADDPSAAKPSNGNDASAGDTSACPAALGRHRDADAANGGLPASGAGTVVPPPGRVQGAVPWEERPAGRGGRGVKSAAWDARAVVEPAPPPGLRDMLVAHAIAQTRAEFDRATQECAICFSARPGAQSVQFAPCGHVVCCECATCYLREASTRGAAVTCPGSECPAPFPHHLAQRLLSAEEFQSYDGRLLESALAALADIVRCPRAACQYAVTRDPADDKLATCFRCRYAFCVDCRQGYHGVEPCRFRVEEHQQLISEYTNGSEEERAALEKRYGQRRLQGLVETQLTHSWLEDNSKPCPHCKAGIEKAFGCNKMVCWRCNTHFCWLCAARLDPAAPYTHYLSERSPCHRLLFQGIDTEPDRDADPEDLDPDDDIIDYDHVFEIVVDV